LSLTILRLICTSIRSPGREEYCYDGKRDHPEVHEYDKNSEQLLEKLNLIISSKSKLEKYLDDVVMYLERRKLLSSTLI